MKRIQENLRFMRNYDGSWVDVKERLPEISGSYLITQMGTTKFGQKQKEPVVQQMTYVCNHDGSEGSFLSNGVMAWMPMPDPYKFDCNTEVAL